MPRKSLKNSGGVSVAAGPATNAEREAIKRVAALATLEASIATSRSQLMAGLGQTYNGARDLYSALGYKKDLRFQDFYNRFVRQGIAKRIVTCFPDATWRGKPDVYETEDSDESTPFESAWDTLAKDLNVWHYFNRVDKLAGIGQYAVLLIGFNDGKPLDQQVIPAANLEVLYLQPYSQDNAVIMTVESDKTSPRYGLPLTYQLKVASVSNQIMASGSQNVTVHWTRVIHVADGLLESNVYGTPRMECVFNNLQDIETITGGSAEMFWRGAFPGLGLEMDPTAVVDDEEALEQEIDEYVHNLRRVLRLKGIKAQSLAPAVSDPTAHMTVQLQLISGATQIPLRILVGSERGELASSMDQDNWNDRVSERREDFAEPMILKPFIEKLLDLHVLPPMQGENELHISWPDLDTLDDKSKAEVSQIRTNALQAYVTSGASAIVGPMSFLTLWMGFSQEEAESMMEEVTQMLAEEQATSTDSMGDSPEEGAPGQPGGQAQDSSGAPVAPGEGESTGEPPAEPQTKVTSKKPVKVAEHIRNPPKVGASV